VALSVQDSFEALSILVTYEESLDPARMGVHEVALLLVHACLGLLAWTLVLAPCPLFLFSLPFFGLFPFYKVWQSFIILVHVFLVKELFITIFGMYIVTHIA